MTRVTSIELGKEVGRCQDAPLMQSVVVVTRNGRDRTMMISADEYRHLKRRDWKVLATPTCRPTSSRRSAARRSIRATTT